MNENAPIDGYQVVTPEIAQTWLALWNYEHQRQIRPYHVNNLANEINLNRFRQKTQINFCHLKNQYYLTNGQHTLSAIIKANKPLMLSVVVLDVNTKLEIAEDFSRHDTHLTRQLAVSLVAHEMHKELGVTSTELNWITSASHLYAFLIGECQLRSSAQLTNDAKIEIVKNYGNLARDALRTYHQPHGKANGYMTKRTTLACAMHVYKWSPDICEVFYGEISKDDGLKIGDPRKTLLEYLRDTRASYGSFSSQKTAIPDHYFLKAQSICFNAFMKDKPLKMIKINHEETEIMFQGPGILKIKRDRP